MSSFMTLKDHVYEYIAEQIQEGKLLPDDKVDEKAICSKLNISRTPVREALIQLASEGIIKNNSRKGFTVYALTAKELEDLYSVIGILDSAAAAAAYNNLSEDDFRDMQFSIDSMDLAINSCNFEMYHKQQKIFHQVYIDKSNNATLISTISLLKNKLVHSNYPKENTAKYQDILRQDNNEHKEILNLFKCGDASTLSKYIFTVHWRPDYIEYEYWGNINRRNSRS